MTREILLAIDGGATHTRCLAIDREGQVVGRGEGGPANHLLTDRATVRASLATAIAAALDSAGATGDEIHGVAAGLAGVDYDGTGADDARTLFDLPERLRVRVRVTIVGDMVIAHAAALGGRPGVVALAGTGSVVLGVGEDGTRIKAGGWGPIYGNEGSAYDLGRRALIAAAHAYDGIGPPTQLRPMIEAALGLRDFGESIAHIYEGRKSSTDIAALAALVTAAAAADDPVARDLITQAAGELAAAVAAVIERVRLAPNARVVSYQGTVLQASALMRAAFTQSVMSTLPGVRVEPPKHEPVLGAYILGCKALGWPIGALAPDALTPGAGGSRGRS